MRVAIYIPTADGNGADVDGFERAMILRDVKVAFANSYGGYSAHDVTGGYVNDAGDLIEENVTVVYTFTDEPNIPELHYLARKVAIRLNQECVAVELGQKMFFEKQNLYPVKVDN